MRQDDLESAHHMTDWRDLFSGAVAATSLSHAFAELLQQVVGGLVARRIIMGW